MIQDSQSRWNDCAPWFGEASDAWSWLLLQKAGSTCSAFLQTSSWFLLLFGNPIFTPVVTACSKMMKAGDVLWKFRRCSFVTQNSFQSTIAVLLQWMHCSQTGLCNKDVVESAQLLLRAAPLKTFVVSKNLPDPTVWPATLNVTLAQNCHFVAVGHCQSMFWQQSPPSHGVIQECNGDAVNL